MPPPPSSSTAIAKEVPDASLQSEEDELSVEQVLVKASRDVASPPACINASEDVMEAKEGSGNEEGKKIASGEDAKAGIENDSGFVPEQQNSKKNLNKSQKETETSLSESQSRTSPNTSPTAASSGIPGAFRVALSSSTGSSRIEINEISDFSNNAETNDNFENNSPAEIADADVEAAPGAVPKKNHKVTTAYLVQDNLAEVEEIKPFYQRKEGRRTITLVTVLLAAMAVLLGVLLSQARRWNQDAELEEQLVASMSPSQAPTFDPRSTFQVVKDRGVVRCGFDDVTEGDEKFGKYNMDFCRGLAAVLFGDPTRFHAVFVGDDRYVKLLGREVDVLYAGDTLTLEKTIKEPTTASGFAFGFPYYGAAVVYAGPDTYVQCANKQKRYDECQDLSICAVNTPDLLLLLPQYFPASFITFGPFPVMEEYLKDGTCNVIVSDTYRLSGSSLQKYIDSGTFVISDYYISRNLLSSVVRYEDDSEWYNTVEASRLSSFRASQMGIYQNISACNETAEQLSSIETTEAQNSVSIYRAPICVGNLVETFQRSLGQNVISYGTFIPAIDAPTFGSLECSDCVDVLNSGKLKAIRERGQLNCAVYLDPVHNLTRSSLATLVNEKFCNLLGVAIFQADPDVTNITYIDNLDYSVFPREYDVVAGAGWEGQIGNSWDPTNAGSMDFGYPYFIHDKYRNNGKIYDGIGFHLSFGIDTEQDQSLLLLSTAVVIATINAQRQGISKATYSDMPLINLFGDSLAFMLRDLIAYGGNYDDIINEAFADSDGTTEIGWNTVIPNYHVAAKIPVLYCDLTGNCPPCMWIDVEGYQVCVSVGAY